MHDASAARAALRTDVDVRTLSGLTDAEAAARVRDQGFNELPAADRRGLGRIALEVVREPMILLLVACCVIYVLLGDRAEAFILLVSVFVVIGISLYQNQKTERALDALRDLSSPRALVIRGGRERRIAGREVVRGDLLVLAEGDRVPADAVLLSSTNLMVDESLLTGEALPVRKRSGDESGDMAPPAGDHSACVYSGTLVVAGQGIARVKATGTATELGTIGKALETTVPERTNLEHETGRVVRVLAAVGMSLCALIVLLYGFTRHDWLQGLLAGVALAMSMMPEEFPVILTIFLALGAWRIAQRNVLTRRTPAIEALGAATVLCVDKTGTLTQNRMSVSALLADGRRYDVGTPTANPLPEAFHPLVEFALLASQRNPFDPMEQAINALGEAQLAGTEHVHDNWQLLHEYPLSEHLLAMSHVWKSRDGDDYVIAAKGAPEAVADLCHLAAVTSQTLDERVAAFAGQGFRVLGVARAAFRPSPLPPEQHAFDFEFLGLVALTDPVRSNAAAAVQECYGAGIRTVMITGDYAGTAQAIAGQVGLVRRDRVVTGPELDALTDEQLAAHIRGVNVFARVVPEQKLRLVNAFKRGGEVVAMTGDGVNDAPALKAAHIGIAMGERGTDVAREAAALVLLDDDFSSIVRAIRLGRRVFDNIRKGMAYALAIHVPIAGTALIPIILGWPLILSPVHIVFLELIIDPACSIAFEAEAEEGNVMRRPPRNPREPLFHRRTIWGAILQGTLALVVVLGVLGFGVARQYGEHRSRTLAFSSLILCNLGLILANRSSSRRLRTALQGENPALWWVVGGALCLLGISVALPPARTVFQFAVPSVLDGCVVVGTAIVALLGFEALKIFAAPISGAAAVTRTDRRAT